jgi:hypothetical protein
VKGTRSTASIVLASLLVVTLAGCGAENTLGPVAANDARMNSGAADLDMSQSSIVEPGPNDPVGPSLSDVSEPGTGSSGASEPKKPKKPKKPKNP